ncbi:MAG: hypothetical protein WBA97_24425 [Actinophytocola sp.]|uniref:hypothetical protein n=1 Tax=Actinophytocola sp. TaxID=1872138 RepID=UPI003C7474A3
MTTTECPYLITDRAYDNTLLVPVPVPVAPPRRRGVAARADRLGRAVLRSRFPGHRRGSGDRLRIARSRRGDRRRSVRRRARPSRRAA